MTLGFPTIEELQARMDARQFAEWRAYYELEPFGQDRFDIPAAVIAREVAVQMGGKDRDLQDFIPKFESTEPKRQTGEDLLAKTKAFVSRFRQHRKK